MYALTIDQRASRRGRDAVPDMLARVEDLAGSSLALPPDRTAGDEFQALTHDPDTAISLVLFLTRTRAWSVGIGVGEVESPLPAQTRAARGSALIRARDAVDRAKGAPGRVALTGPEGIPSRDAEAYLRLLVELRDRRSPQGWEVADMLTEGRSQREIADLLDITPSAVSRRASAAAVRLEHEVVPALVRTIARLDRVGGA